MQLKVAGHGYYCPFPIGSIYLNVSKVNPSDFWPNTVWVRIASGMFLVSSGGSTTGDYAIGETGGSASVSLTIGQMPSHAHETTYTFTGFCGTGGTWLPGYTSTGGASNTNITPAYINKTGGGEAHENLPPYLSVDMWRRTA